MDYKQLDNDDLSIRKVCFFVDSERCRRIDDICHAIKQRYYSSASPEAKIELFLDGDFLLPGQEKVNVVQNDDLYTCRVKFQDISSGIGTMSASNKQMSTYTAATSCMGKHAKRRKLESSISQTTMDPTSTRNSSSDVSSSEYEGNLTNFTKLNETEIPSPINRTLKAVNNTTKIVKPNPNKHLQKKSPVFNWLNISILMECH